MNNENYQAVAKKMQAEMGNGNLTINFAWPNYRTISLRKLSILFIYASSNKDSA